MFYFICFQRVNMTQIQMLMRLLSKYTEAYFAVFMSMWMQVIDFLCY